MELTGKIIEILKEQKGESARGHWRKQEYVLETGGQYPKKVCFMVWGEKINDFAIKEGEDLVVSINLESREYNGRWYTDVKAWKINRSASSMNSFAASQDEEFEDFERNADPLEGDIPF